MSLVQDLAEVEARYAAGAHVEHLRTLRRYAPTMHRATPAQQATWAAWMGFLHSVTGARPQVVQQYCQRSAHLAKAHGLHSIQGMAECCAAQQYYIVGNLVAGAQAGARALAVFTEFVNYPWACRALWHLSTIANAAGSWAQSRQYCRQALTLGELADDARLQQVSRWRLGGVAILAGHYEEGLRLCEHVLHDDPAPTDRTMTEVMTGCGLVKAGDQEAGIEQLELSVDWLKNVGLQYTALQASLYLGEAYQAEGQSVRARRFLMDTAIACQRAGYRLLEATGRSRWRQTFDNYDPLFYEKD